MMEVEGTKAITCSTVATQDLLFNLESCGFSVKVEVQDVIFIDRFE
jgi:hypothetical protein